MKWIYINFSSKIQYLIFCESEIDLNSCLKDIKKIELYLVEHKFL